MIILIAESKTMSSACGEIAPQGGVPQFEAQAEEIMDGLRGRSVAALGADLKLGPKNAQRLYEEIYDFPNKATGCAAIDAYTGVVFRALDVPSLSVEARQRLNADVRIVSSLYGMLRPNDIVKSYRFDFGMKGAPGGGSLAPYWKPQLTEALTEKLQATGEKEILNLMPQDACKCFDWKVISGIADVYSAGFKELADGGELRTPNSDKLKKLRGKLLRYILENDIADIASLRRVELPEFAGFFCCDVGLASTTGPGGAVL